MNILGDLTAITEVKARVAVVKALGDSNRASCDFPGVADEVDDTSGSIGRQCRGRPADDRLRACDAIVIAEPLVRSRERHVTELKDGQTVLLKLDILGAARGDRQPASREVQITVSG